MAGKLSLVAMTTQFAFGMPRPTRRLESRSAARLKKLTIPLSTFYNLTPPTFRPNSRSKPMDGWLDQMESFSSGSHITWCLNCLVASSWVFVADVP
ncbi:hypothetical protein C8R44DRAFT_759327 [Mycena epipterygia]|nr:hypothetical protein C8R44DRAFT_759327 [Mycena epipterygia]